jgi:hypothetical protein
MINLDFILKKIIFLKSHAINMIFKDAIVLKKEQLDDKTKEDGIEVLQKLMTKAILKLAG